MAVVQIQSRSVPLFLRFISSVRPCAHSSSSICSSSVPRGFESRPKLMQNKRRTFITRGRAGPGRAGPGLNNPSVVESHHQLTSLSSFASSLHLIRITDNQPDSDRHSCRNYTLLCRFCDSQRML